MIPVILSGGSGERLWPLSRAMYPKQFQNLTSENTLFQETLIRLSPLKIDPPIVVCNEEHRFIAAENMRALEVSAQHILLEPEGRNTAPAIALAALIASAQDDPVLFVMPADHIIKDQNAFETAVKQAEQEARSGALVTFGITPDRPHTGYGYIECGKAISAGVYTLTSFREKPDEQIAKEFIKSGNYLWNSGMFVFKASAYIKALEEFEPEILQHAKQAMSKTRKDLDFTRIDESAFKECKNISIDYAVMERTDKGRVIPLDAGWSDIGSWETLYEALPKDDNSNVIHGDVHTRNATGSMIHADHKLVTVLDVDDLVIVDTKDALLVASRKKAHNVREVAKTLKSKSRTEAKHHRTVYRPWGHYDSICVGTRDQVKRITVKPGAKLSLQKHEHRSEHWVVVKGTARVTKGDGVFDLHENESVYIPLGTKHALENAGNTPLEIIEVQTGNYLGEDDIIRFEDLYGRK